MKILFNKKGQSLVETAITLPIIILLLAGIIDFGLIFNNYLVIANASREGARKAAVGMTDGDINLYIQDIVSSLNDANVTVTITPSEISRVSGDDVTVIIGYDNYLITPVVTAVIPNPVHIESKTIMRVE
jgi:Flp pilus assembly protein TadG